jgi:hypothetical protein
LGDNKAFKALSGESLPIMFDFICFICFFGLHAADPIKKNKLKLLSLVLGTTLHYN